MSRGYFGIGVFHPKAYVNIGTLWRSAYIYNANFVFTIGRRYKKQASDTLKSWRHVPIFNFSDWEDFKKHIPYDCNPICIEITDKAIPLQRYIHPERVVYVLGAEDHGIPERILASRTVVKIASKRCLNVAVAGSIVMYDRFVKSQ